jgi:hypothetical protein
VAQGLGITPGQRGGDAKNDAAGRFELEELLEGTQF